MKSPRTITASDLAALSKRKPRVRGVAPKEQRTYNGHVYHSKAEAKQAAELDLLVKCGEVRFWQPQASRPIHVNGKYICTVLVDFYVAPSVGGEYWLEVKGHETEIYKLKRKLLMACYPGLDYRVVKV